MANDLLPVVFRRGDNGQVDNSIPQILPSAVRRDEMQKYDDTLPALVPEVFRFQGQRPQIVNWEDIIDGCGYKRFYAAGSVASGAEVHFLTSRILDSSSYRAGTGWGFKQTVNSSTTDYEIITQVPFILASGSAIINFSESSNRDGEYIQNHLLLYHVTTGGTATLLGSFNCPTRLGETTSPHINYRECAKIAVPRKKFSIGEIIRLTVSGAAMGLGYYYIDPHSTTTFTDPEGRTIGSDFIVDLPIKIDI